MGKPLIAPAQIILKWHTYSMDWSSNSIKVYIDGVLQSITTSDSQTGIPFTPMYPILDYTIGTGNAPASGSQMDGDYVRIWQ